MFPRDIVCLRNISTLHKGDDDDDDNNNSNNVKVLDIYYGVRIKIFAHLVGMYLSDRKNLLDDR